LGKVYRRDQPNMKSGRFREFWQCDLDIAGVYTDMIADAEVIKVINDILIKLDIGRFCIKINHRKLLESMFEVSGCNLKMFATICSSIDKLDKEPWENVRKELVDKGVSNESCDVLNEFVLKRDEPLKLLEYLKSSKL